MSFLPEDNTFMIIDYSKSSMYFMIQGTPWQVYARGNMRSYIVKEIIIFRKITYKG